MEHSACPLGDEGSFVDREGVGLAAARTHGEGEHEQQLGVAIDPSRLFGGWQHSVRLMYPVLHLQVRAHEEQDVLLQLLELWFQMRGADRMHNSSTEVKHQHMHRTDNLRCNSDDKISYHLFRGGLAAAGPKITELRVAAAAGSFSAESASMT